MSPFSDFSRPVCDHSLGCSLYDSEHNGTRSPAGLSGPANTTSKPVPKQGGSSVGRLYRRGHMMSISRREDQQLEKALSSDLEHGHEKSSSHVRKPALCCRPSQELASFPPRGCLNLSARDLGESGVAWVTGPRLVGMQDPYNVRRGGVVDVVYCWRMKLLY